MVDHPHHVFNSPSKSSFDLYDVEVINENKFNNEIINNKGLIIVIDLRSNDDFLDYHYPTYSINIPYDSDFSSLETLSNINDLSFFLQFVDNKNKELKNVIKRMKRYYIVIVTSNDNITKKQLSNIYYKNNNSFILSNKDLSVIKGLMIYKTLIKLKIREMSFFCGAYKRFIEEYKELAVYHFEKMKFFNEPYPSTIINGKLYVGDQSHVSDLEKLRLLKITHIINVTQHIPNYYCDNIKYLTIPIEDTDKYCIASHFRDAFNFIDEAIYGINVANDTNNSSNKSNDSNKDINDSIKIMNKMLHYSTNNSSGDILNKDQSNTINKEFSYFEQKDIINDNNNNDDNDDNQQENELYNDDMKLEQSSSRSVTFFNSKEKSNQNEILHIHSKPENIDQVENVDVSDKLLSKSGSFYNAQSTNNNSMNVIKSNLNSINNINVVNKFKVDVNKNNNNNNNSNNQVIEENNENSAYDIKQQNYFNDSDSIETINEEIDLLQENLKKYPCSFHIQNEILQLKAKKLLIETKSNNNNRVLIHCSLGVSRSPSIAVMYLMKKFKLHFQLAIDLVKYQRNKSCPQQSFMIELEQFEKQNFDFKQQI